MADIIKTVHGIKYKLPDYLTQCEKDTITYIVSSYSFILPRFGEFTFLQLAEEIEKVYDCSDLRHGYNVSLLKSLI